MADYSSLGHPYCRDYMITSNLTWVLCMSPLMAQLLGEAEFMEADVTYKASIEFEYLFNVVVFNYTTLRCKYTCHIIKYTIHVHAIYVEHTIYHMTLHFSGHVVARVRLDRLTAEAYEHCFKSVFVTAKETCPQFEVGKTLLGVILDWSDQQMKGLEGAVGEETAAKVAKGCRVHFTRSVKRVSERINKRDSLVNKAFTTIAYNVTNMTSKEDVQVLFDVLAGKRELREAVALCAKSTVLETYAKDGGHNPDSWKACSHWAEWWQRDRHLRKLSKIL